MRYMVSASLTLCLSVAAAFPAAADEFIDPVVETPGQTLYYLAIGDSLAAGAQPVGRKADDRVTRMGYPDQLWLMARASYPNLELVNVSCPGEDTEKLRLAHGRCAYEHGSQFAEALAFIEAHRDDLAFITIDIGFNDFPCSNDLMCLFPGIDSINDRLPSILDELLAAAPGVPIVGMNIYDPFLTYWFGSDDDKALARQTVVAVRILNETLADVYEGAGIPVADVERAFAIDDWDTLVPMAGHGDVPRNVAILCERTWQCFPPPLGPDRHPNVLGARAIAEAFARELGLAPVETGIERVAD